METGNPMPGKVVSLAIHPAFFVIRKHSQWGFYVDGFLGDGSEVDIRYLIYSIFDSLTAENKVLEPFAHSNTANNLKQK